MSRASSRCAYANIRSILANNHFLEWLLSQNSINIFAFSETWLKPTQKSSTILKKNSKFYSLLRCDRNTPRGKRGGGVCLFVHKSLLYREIFSQSCENSHELLIVDVTFETFDTVRFVVVYRVPALSRASSELLWKSIQDNLLCAHPIILVGDLNLPDIKWNVSPPSTTSATENDFLDFCSVFDLEQTVNFPTRGTAFLDLLLSNDRNILSNIEKMPPFDNADHDAIFSK